MDEIDVLKRQILDKETELASLRSRLREAERITTDIAPSQEPELLLPNSDDQPTHPDWKWPLRADEYERYGRQLLIPEVGVKGAAHLACAALSLLPRAVD